MHKTLRMLDNTMDIFPGQLPRSLERGRGSSGFRRQRTWQSTIGSDAGSTCMYRDEINSLQIQLSRTQAGSGKAVKEQQKKKINQITYKE